MEFWNEDFNINSKQKARELLTGFCFEFLKELMSKEIDYLLINFIEYQFKCQGKAAFYSNIKTDS